MPREILTDAKQGRKSVKLLIVLGVIVVALVTFGLLSAFTPKEDPMAQFITEKNCSFLIMPDMARAVCTDGTAYDVILVGVPAPLP
jgi:hypothetical protein